MRKAVRKFKETVEIRSSIINRFRSHRYFSAAVLVCVILAASCFHVWQGVKVMTLVKETARLRSENADLVNNIKKVSSDISSLEMASRILPYGRDSLGLKVVSADRLFTLAPKEARAERRDDLNALTVAIKRVARYMPVVSQTSVHASELRPLDIDYAALKGNDR